MKFSLLCTIVLFLLLISGCDLFSDDSDSGVENNSSEIGVKRLEVRALYDEYIQLHSDSYLCESTECLNKKAELLASAALLEEMVNTANYSNAMSATETSEILAMSDSSFTIDYKDYWCEGTILKYDSGQTVVDYSIEEDGLHFNNYGCQYRLYSGSSSDIVGTWKLENSTIFSVSTEGCLEPEEGVSGNIGGILKRDESLTITENSYIINRVAYFNCYVDDFVAPFDSFRENFRKIDCNTWEYTQYGLTIRYRHEVNGDHVAENKIYTYNGKSCTMSRKEFIGAGIAPECPQTDCFEELLKEYCDDLKLQMPNENSEEFRSFEIADDMCHDYFMENGVSPY